jgi:phospholipid/cholesterol/gamma-HCH transport system substrate-binding protein
MTSSTRRRLSCAALAGAALLIAGCESGGLNSLDMPGTAGHGPKAFTITVELPNVSAMPQNSPVLVRDVTVGSVAGIQAVQRPDGTFCAAVKLALDAGVRLPANTEVRVAQTSLLGSQHIELAAPVGPAIGRLTAGATLPLSRAMSYPSTEEVLSSLGFVVNKGNLGALQDISDELYHAVAGRAGQWSGLVPRLADLAKSIDRQTNEIIAAATGVARLTAILAHGNDGLARTLDAMPTALKALDDNGANIVAAFTALQRLSDTTAHVLSKTKSDLAADIKDVYPVAKALAENADALVKALPYLPTFPLPGTYLNQAIRGDFLNSFITFDLTVRRLGETLFTTSGLDQNMKHLDEMINAPDFLLGATANLSGQAADPFKIPPAQQAAR